MVMKYQAILKYQLYCTLFNFFCGILYIMEVGNKLNPQRSYRKGFALKGLRQHIIKTNNPSTIGPGELFNREVPRSERKSGNYSKYHEIDFQHHSSRYRCK